MMSIFKPSSDAPSKWYAHFTTWMIVYTLLVILWGAWVRISHSGDGCGATWPLCNGVFMPEEAPRKTWVEFAHRIQSGVFGILVIVLAGYARRLFPKGHPVRFWGLLSLFFTVTEALLGAKLVVFGLTGDNDSAFRAFAMTLHFLNSVLLVASLTQLALVARRSTWVRRTKEESFLSRRMAKRLPTIAGAVFLFLGGTGAIAALSTTLFPSTSIIAGITADFNESSHFLLRLRGIHPTLGVFAGVGLTLLFYFASELSPVTEVVFRRRSWIVIGVVATTVVLGSITLLWLSPIPLKILHLLLAHCLGISLVCWWQSLRYKLD